MSAPSVPSYPLFLYLYDENGRYENPTEIADESTLEAAMRIMVRDHISRGLEVRITNLVDELVFHSQNGKVLWPTDEEVRRIGDDADRPAEG
jgi:hypothetical protein